MARVGFKIEFFIGGGDCKVMIRRFSIADVWSDTIMASLVSCGVRHVAIAPGSRSTPLVLSANRHPQLELISHFDERGLGFFALGLAKSTGCPVAIVVTSGTAVANLLPAIIEAFQTGIPLAVITADRPPELWGTGANQCIRQVGIFSHYVVSEWCMPVPNMEISLSQIWCQLESVWSHFHGRRPGPVHLNCPFREPLFGTELTDFFDEDFLGLSSTFSFQVLSCDRHFISKDGDDFIAWASSGPGVIVLGQNHSAEDARLSLKLATYLDWMVLPDATSSLKSLSHPLIFHHYDMALELKGPSVLSGITRVFLVGGFCVSKSLISWLASSELSIFQVMISDVVWQPHITISKRVVVSLSMILDRVDSSDTAYSAHPDTASILMRLSGLNLELSQGIQVAVDQMPLSEPWIGAELMRQLASGWVLMIGNSLPVRLLDQWALPSAQLVTVMSNRGASGIDGVIATGVGVAWGAQCPVVIWIGDMSFAYDVSSLSLLMQSPIPVIVVVTNNRGGRIFEQLPVASATSVFEPYFVLPNLPSIEYASRMVGLPYYEAGSAGQFLGLFSELKRFPTSCVIEVRCDSSSLPQCKALLKSVISYS